MENPEKLATRRKHNTISVGHHNAKTNTNNVKKRHEPSYKQLEVKTNQTNTNKVIKTWALLQTTGGKDESNKHK